MCYQKASYAHSSSLKMVFETIGMPRIFVEEGLKRSIYSVAEPNES